MVGCCLVTSCSHVPYCALFFYYDFGFHLVCWFPVCYFKWRRFQQLAACSPNPFSCWGFTQNISFWNWQVYWFAMKYWTSDIQLFTQVSQTQETLALCINFVQKKKKKNLNGINRSSGYFSNIKALHKYAESELRMQLSSHSASRPLESDSFWNLSPWHFLQ